MGFSRSFLRGYSWKTSGPSYSEVYCAHWAWLAGGISPIFSVLQFFRTLPTVA